MTEPSQTSQATPDPVHSGRRSWLKYALFGLPVGGAAAMFVGGIVFWGGFNTAVVATNTEQFCISCHEMNDFVYAEYQGTIHDVNRSGVGAVCSDCHVPKDWTHKMIRKVKATRELYGKVMGTISTPEKFEAKRLHLAMNEWERMKANDSRECRNCHDFQSMLPEKQKSRARKQHLFAMEQGQTCIDCHKGVAHADLRDRADEDYLEKLEAPNPAFVRTVPPIFLASLAKIEEAEKAAEDKAAEDARKLEDYIQTRVAEAAEKAREEERALLAAADAPASDAAAETASDASGAGGDDPAANIDWDGVPITQTKLFYPGQASFEWVQNGRGHGGARPFTKGGELCSSCHAKELDTIGQNIVTGGNPDLEPTPIPGKRGSIDLTVQAAHDTDNLYMRLSWKDTPHAPVPFVDGGKMDPENPIKVAMMIVGNGIERAEQSGCWASCHSDNRYMPTAPDQATLDGSGEIAASINALDGVMKYLPESRTEIELKGRKAPLGGWDKVKAVADLEAYLNGGTFMDLLRVNADGTASNGHILEKRTVGGELSAKAVLDGDTWIVTFARSLKGDVGDVPLEAGQTYTVGFAVHDDYSAARFHHVSLDMRLALDSDAAEINAVSQ